MVSPNLIRRQNEEKALELNDSSKKLFQVIYSERSQAEEINDSEPKIKVSELISRLAFVYEKLRNAVDYDEEHLLRKNAIARILRRQVVIEGVIKEVDGNGLATHLLAELIRGGYLPNNKIPETKITEVALLLEKYLYLKDQILEHINDSLVAKTEIAAAKKLLREKNKIIRWLINLAACEIEERLAPDKVKQLIVNNLFDVLGRDISLPKDSPYLKDLEIQIYLSIGRKYLKLDEEMLSFILFKYYHESWLEFNNPKKINNHEDLKKIAYNIQNVRNNISVQLAHPLGKQLDKIGRRYALSFTVLAETIIKDPVKVYGELQKGEKSFFSLIRKTCEAKYLKAKSKLWKAAMRSIIYIFLTKSIFVFLIEVPAINWFNEPLNPISLGINVIFPAFLLFVVVLFTQKPRESNTVKIISGIKQIAMLGEESKQPIILRTARKRNTLVSLIFNLIYTAAFIFSVYMIVTALTFINFTWVSVIIFLFFLAFVSFFSIIVSRGVKDLMIEERRENLVTFLVDLFYMPIILVGRWLSGNMSRVNIFIFIFDFLIEAPFKVVVNIAEDWTRYVRERRDNME